MRRVNPRAPHDIGHVKCCPETCANDETFGSPDGTWPLPTKNFGGTASCTPHCDLCSSDCDADSDCLPGLKCLQRDGDAGTIPGCARDSLDSTLKNGYDLCYDPTKSTTGEAKGENYRGCQSKSVNGFTCKLWSLTSTSSSTAVQAMGEGDHNFCRNPNGASDTIWCYVYGSTNHWDYCVPQSHVGQSRR